MIREITKDDKQQVLRLAELFFKERLERTGCTFCSETAAAHFDQLVMADGILALGAEKEGVLVGMIAGIASSMIFAKELVMQEIVWYVEPEQRKCGLRLLREFEKRASARGVSFIMMVGMSGDPVLDVYPRLGYFELHKTFLKPL